MNLQFHAATFLLCFVAVASLPAAGQAATNADPPAAAYVRPINFAGLAVSGRGLPERSKALIKLYSEGARRYVLTQEDGAFPARGSEHFRNIAERGHGAAVLAAVASDWPEELRERCRRESTEFVKEFTAQFGKDRNFGNKWQSSWWVAEMATAAWFLWDRLDPALREGVAEMVVYHADLIAGQEPGARIKLDTEAETVAWNSTILALAPNMMPKHPHAAKWQAAAQRYAYTVFATPHDLTDATPGDDGKPIKDWVAGANIHDDFTLENHNRFHIDYELTCYRFLYFDAAMYRLAGNSVPGAFRHHTLDVYEKVMLACTDASKFAVYVSDNDWKRYHAWTESPAVHGFIALTESSPLASELEEQSLRTAVAYWRAFPEKFGYANPYVCGKAWTPRIADIVLLHLLSPPAAPLSASQAEARLRGVHIRPDVNLLTHYSREGSFRSFYFGPGPTVRHVEPRDNAWMMLPLTPDYGVTINGKAGTDAGAKVTFRKGDDWFWTMRRDTRGVDEAFVSLPDEMVVSVISVPASALKGVKKLDCMVGVEKPHTTFSIFYDGEEWSFRYGQKAWDRPVLIGGPAILNEWINLADCMGYVVVNLSAGESRMVLPKPGVRDFLSLRHVENPHDEQCFVTIALPNQDHRRTQTMSSQVSASHRDGVVMCLTPQYFVWANFTDQEAEAKKSNGTVSVGPVKSFPHSVGILRMKDDGKTWSKLE